MFWYVFVYLSLPSLPSPQTYTHTQEYYDFLIRRKYLCICPRKWVLCMVGGLYFQAALTDLVAQAFTKMLCARFLPLEGATEWVCKLSKPLLSARWVCTSGKELSPEMPAKEVTEPTRLSELKTRPVLGNWQEAVLADSRPWAACQVLAQVGQLEEAEW